MTVLNLAQRQYPLHNDVFAGDGGLGVGYQEVAGIPQPSVEHDAGTFNFLSGAGLASGLTLAVLAAADEGLEEEWNPS